MIEGRIVTNETAQELQGVFFDSDTFFNFVQDINDVYFLFLSEQDAADIANTEYNYLLEIPLSPFEPKPNPPFPPIEN
jgi:hypothetical protein